MQRTTRPISGKPHRAPPPSTSDHKRRQRAPLFIRNKSQPARTFSPTEDDAQLCRLHIPSTPNCHFLHGNMNTMVPGGCKLAHDWRMSSTRRPTFIIGGEEERNGVNSIGRATIRRAANTFLFQGRVPTKPIRGRLTQFRGDIEGEIFFFC